MNKIGNFIMNEEELFNSENNIQSFKLLESIQKALILNNLELKNFNQHNLWRIYCNLRKIF